MKHFLTPLAIVAAVTSLQAAPAGAVPTMYADATYASEYVFRGVENAGQSFQPSIEFASDGFNFGAWSNLPLSKGEMDEFDFFAGYQFAVAPFLKLEAIATYYWYPEARPSLGQSKSTFEAGLGGSITGQALTPGLFVFYDTVLDSYTVQGTLDYTIPLKPFGLSIDLSLNGGRVETRDATPEVAGPEVKRAYSYFGGDVSVPYAINDRTTVKVGLHYSHLNGHPLSGGAGGAIADQNLWFTARLSFGF